MSVKRAQRGWRLKAYSGENIQDVLVTLDVDLFSWLNSWRKQPLFIAVLTALAVTLSKSLFLTHLANGLSNTFILSHKELCVCPPKKNPSCSDLVFAVLVLLPFLFLYFVFFSGTLG